MRLSKEKVNYILALFNTLFLVCGIILTLSGAWLLQDSRRVLLSTLLLSAESHTGSGLLHGLAQPLLYYAGAAACLAGLFTCATAAIGCGVACCTRNRCLAVLYCLLVTVILLAQGLVCLMLSLWPSCLGLDLDATLMVRALQRNYGMPGQEQFTLAMDLAQTQFECCAINDVINYDTSLWRLQGMGRRELVVPYTCCHLSNAKDPHGYLDPKPVNISICESLAPETNIFGRYQQGCLPAVELWYHQHYTIFLAGSLIFVLIEFAVLLSTLLTCPRYSTKIQPSPEHNSKPIHIISSPDEIDRTLFDDEATSAELSLDYMPPRQMSYRKNNGYYRPYSRHAPAMSSFRGYVV